MPDGPFATPDEATLLRMMRRSGGPEAAAQDLVSRLEALEAEVAALSAAYAELGLEEGTDPAAEGAAPQAGDGTEDPPATGEAAG